MYLSIDYKETDKSKFMERNKMDKNTTMESLARAAYEKGGFNGAWLYAEKGKIVSSGALGWVDAENSLPMREDSIFEMASVTKMALGSLGIGLGFGLPCIIYTNEKLSRSVQIAIHMVAGCAIMLTIAFLVGWIPTDKGLLPALQAVASMLLTAFVISVLSYRRQKKLAERINRELKLRRQ